MSDLTATSTLLNRGLRAGLWSRIRWVLLVGTIVVRCVGLYIAGPVLGTDQGYQIGGARSLLDGRGVSVTIFQEVDVSKQTVEPLRWWPPFYSLVAAPLLAAFDDPGVVLAITTAAGIVLMYGAWFVILETLGRLVDLRSRLLLWLYWMLVAPPITIDGNTGATDYLALGCFSVGLACAVRLITNPQHMGAWSIAAGAAVGLGAALRYAYIPVAVIVPGSLAAIGLVNRKWRWLGAAIICAASILIVMGMNAVASRVASPATNPSDILGASRSFSSVIRRLAPIPAMAFGLGSSWHPGSPNTVFLWIVSGAMTGMVIIVVAIHLYRLIRRPAAYREGVAGVTFIYVALILGLATLVGTFTYLSIKQAPQSDWVIVEEGRYYAPIFGLFVFTAFVNVFATLRSSRIVVTGAVCLLILVTGIAVYEKVDAWPRRRPIVRGITMKAQDSQWQHYFAIRALIEQGHEVAFLDTGVANWHKAWATAAGANIYRTIHIVELRGPIRTSRPVDVVALSLEGSHETAIAALVKFVKSGTIRYTSTYASKLDRGELYVLRVRSDRADARRSASRPASRLINDREADLIVPGSLWRPLRSEHVACGFGCEFAPVW